LRTQVCGLKRRISSSTICSTILEYVDQADLVNPVLRTSGIKSLLGAPAASGTTPG
jgi:hypothetical protein